MKVRKGKINHTNLYFWSHENVSTFVTLQICAFVWFTSHTKCENAETNINKNKGYFSLLVINVV